MNRITIASTAGMLLTVTAASAGVTQYTSDGSMLTDVTNSADFNALVPGQSLMGYEEDGLRLSVNRTYFSWDAPGLDGSEMFYSNTGALELVDITLNSGDNFQDVDMQIASGWTADAIGEVYIWAQLYDDGSLVGEFDVDLMSGSYLGFAGGGFDQTVASPSVHRIGRRQCTL